MTDEALCAPSGRGTVLRRRSLSSATPALVRICARPYFLAGGDSEDLHAGGHARPAIKAIREYDPRHGASFHTFAETCIRNRLYSVLPSAASRESMHR